MLLALPAQADTLRIALFHTDLGRDGPGLLLRDIRQRTPDVLAARDAIVAARPDVLLLLDLDYDLDGLALAAFADLLTAAGLALPHRIALRPNTGMATGLDMDGDGRFGTLDDAQGWGRFAGAGGMAMLSRLPIRADTLIDHSALLWRDLPDARLPRVDGALFPSDAVFAEQRLSSTNHWEVAIDTPSGLLHLMAWHAGPPAFGGPHDRNRLRNGDETAFWRRRLDGAFGPAPPTPFVLLGGANLDPDQGDGDHDQIRALLQHPALLDPAPRAAAPPPGVPPTATAHWPDGPGALRVDYLLPSEGLQVRDSGLVWPQGTAHHALVWVSIAWPP
ncbi:MAG: endonuclease/exonuclease/phosphatase family protein [Rhodobacteraceae bacterium]|nr:endonuclease/exonuclease/phosphatase family protein [Paracoccaceae bacterium]